MHKFMNGVKAQASQQARTVGVARMGIVQSYDPTTGTARVTLQPDNVLTGWLPVVSAWGGAGWGVIAHLSGDEQVLVVMQEGNADSGVIAGRVWSDAERPPGGVGGEFWLTHETGSLVKLTNDGKVMVADEHGSSLVFGNNGTITLTATTVQIEGNLLVSGDITDNNRTGSKATLAEFRAAYDAHGHSYLAGTSPSTTGTPNDTV